MEYPIWVVRGAVGHSALFNGDLTGPLSCQHISGAYHASLVQNIVRVADNGFFGRTVILNTRAANQRTGLAQHDITCRGRGLASSICGDTISTDLQVALAQRHITLKQ